MTYIQSQKELGKKRKKDNQKEKERERQRQKSLLSTREGDCLNITNFKSIGGMNYSNISHSPQSEQTPPM